MANALFLDMTKAFNNVFKDKLLYNLYIKKETSVL